MISPIFPGKSWQIPHFPMISSFFLHEIRAPHEVQVAATPPPACCFRRAPPGAARGRRTTRGGPSASNMSGWGMEVGVLFGRNHPGYPGFLGRTGMVTILILFGTTIFSYFFRIICLGEPSWFLGLTVLPFVHIIFLGGRGNVIESDRTNRLEYDMNRKWFGIWKLVILCIILNLEMIWSLTNFFGITNWLVPNVGNGWVAGNRMVVKVVKWIGSFPHSLRLAPVGQWGYCTSCSG